MQRIPFAVRRLSKAVVAAVLVSLAGVAAAGNGGTSDCYSDDYERRVSGCTELIETPGLPANELSLAYSLRALAYSIKGLYDLALPDYNAAIRINPDFAIALNNRAWAYFKSGRAAEGVRDVERSLELSPGNPQALDTRAHIRQVMGRPAEALQDYEFAMRFGGERIIMLYQCGLQSLGLYSGSVDGIYSRTLRRALETCVTDPQCDPLPADEECRKVVS